ncbi:MAG TPA: GFA family protein [Usitatibacter sp.]|nr:GFA family protein [Usitatibacter sp.]
MVAQGGEAIARCHCGGVEMVASFPSRFCAHCYCNSCRVTHASGVVTWIGFKRSQIHFTRGEELVRDYLSSPGTRRKFCNRCGTRLAFESERENWGDEMHLPLALFVTPVDRAPSGNSFPEERPEWAPLANLRHD